MSNIIIHPTFDHAAIRNGRHRGQYPRKVTSLRRYKLKKSMERPDQVTSDDLSRERKAIFEARAYLEKGPTGDALRSMKEIRFGYMELAYAACKREHEILNQIVSGLARTEENEMSDASTAK